MSKGKSKKPVARKRRWDWLFWIITLALVAVIVIAFRQDNSISTNQVQNPHTVQQPVSSNQVPAQANSETPNVKVETPGGDNGKFTVQTIPSNTQGSTGN